MMIFNILQLGGGTESYGIILGVSWCTYSCISSILCKFHSLLVLSPTGDQIGFVIPRKSGGYVIGQDRSICHLDWPSGTVTEFVSVEDGTNNRFNDAKCDASGRLWAGRNK